MGPKTSDLADVDIALYVALERSVVNSGKQLEQHFDETETFSTVSADVSVWELVALFLDNLRNQFKLCVVIHPNWCSTASFGYSEQSFLSAVPVEEYTLFQ